MKTKIIAAIVIVIIVVAAVGVGAYFLSQKDKDTEINVIAGVNLEGSGLYIKSNVDIDTMFDFSTSIPTPIASGWEGKVFGTPGTATIQHVQLLQLVKSMGMNFSPYTGSKSDPNTVYYVPMISNASLALGNPDIDGGSLWQPQYQKIVDDSSGKFKELALTNDLFPGHACCVVAGDHEYTSGHENETVQFLAAYIKGVNWVNAAISAGAIDENNSDYKHLVSIAMDIAGPNFTDTEIKEALSTVTYFYGDDSSTPLSNLGGQISNLSEQLVSLGATYGKTLTDSGFSSGSDFTDKFVDDSFLVKATQLVAEYPDGMPNVSNKENITVAVIAGDIHQIAVHVADRLGFFGEYGLNVTFALAVNGPGVATSLQNGTAPFGLLGAPPITITVISGELLKA